MEHWRKALDSVARISYLTHSFKSAGSNLQQQCLACYAVAYAVTAGYITSSVACSSDVKLVDAVQEHFLEVFCPLSRPAVEHEVELPGVVDDLRSQLLKCKVSISFCVAVYLRCLGSLVHSLYVSTCMTDDGFYLWKLLNCIESTYAQQRCVQVLGLWGMGGIGKTTLAAKLFNSLLPTLGMQPASWEMSAPRRVMQAALSSYSRSF